MELIGYMRKKRFNKLRGSFKVSSKAKKVIEEAESNDILLLCLRYDSINHSFNVGSARIVNEDNYVKMVFGDEDFGDED